MNEANEKSENNEKNAPPGKLFLLAVLAFGIGATWASTQWLSNGAITIRSGTKGIPQGRGAIVGQIVAEQGLFYPLCIAWGALGVTMIALSGLAFVWRRPLLLRLSAYALASILPLGFATFLAAWLLKP
jgi:hypothetical protein